MKKLSTLCIFILLFSAATFAQIVVSGSNVSSNGNFSTLKAAFDAINAVDQTGSDIVIQVSASITDNNTATLNNGVWNSLEIYPTISGVVLSGNIAAPLIDFNGSSRITIDGRVNKTGTTKSLAIQNTSNSTVSNEISTIRFINGVSNNVIQYCIIKGAARTTASDHNPSISGNIFISTGGNSNIVIQNNDITMVDNANRPYNGIYSRGATEQLNTNITIQNNHFYDLLHPAGTNYHHVSCVYLHSFTSHADIISNHFFQTITHPASSWNHYYFININSVQGSSFKVTNNRMGGREPNCGGDYYTTTENASQLSYRAVSVNSSLDGISTIDGNVLRNFSHISAGGSASYLWAFELRNGRWDVGLTEGNVMGSDSGNGSILLHHKSATTNQYTAPVMFWISGNTTGIIANNKMGSITMTSAGAYFYFSGLWNQSSETVTVENNLFGSIDADTENSILMDSPNVNLVFYGMSLRGGTNIVRNNIISKITNKSTTDFRELIGIQNLRAGTQILNNTIKDITSHSTNNRNTAEASVIGIVDSQSATITGNYIYDLRNVNENFPGAVYGIIKQSGFVSTIQRNYIYNLEATGSNATGANVYGISTNMGSNIYNNLISLSGSSKASIYGVFKTGNSSACNIYFNTVHITGVSGNTSAKSACLFEDVITNQTRNIRNNILMNDRSTTDGEDTNFAAYFNHAISANTTLDYNNYYVSGTGGVLGYWNSSNKNMLPLIDTKDANSYNQNPIFAEVGTSNPLHYKPYNSFVGAHIATVTVDYANKTRNNPPYIGAFDVAPTVKWTGNVNSNWNNEENWYPRFPLANDNIIIPEVANKPVLPTSGIISSMEVEDNASWLVPSNGKLTLNNLSNAGNIVIESTNTHTGQLMIDNLSAQTGKLLLRKTFTANNWQFVSFPYTVTAANVKVAGSSTQAVWGDLGGVGSDFVAMQYNGQTRDAASTASAQNGLHWENVAGRVFEKNKGYIIAVGSDITLDFVSSEGESSPFVLEGQVEVQKFNTSPRANHRSWNLIGQPYLSAFNLLNATQAHAPYYYYNGVNYTPVMPEEAYSVYPFSSFFVQAHGASDEVRYAIAGRVLRSVSAPSFEQISLVLQDNAEATYTDKTRIRLQEARTVNYELGFDAIKMFSMNTQVPQIYTKTKGTDNVVVNYAVNSLPTNTTIVDLVVSTGKAGSYTISLENIDDAPSYSSIILVVGTKEYDLLEGSYTFSTSKAQTMNWKVKLVQGVVTQVAQTADNSIDVATVDNKVYINGLESEATVSVYTVSGKLVQTISNVQNNQALTINNTGVSVLSITTATQQAQAKVYLY